MHPISWMDNQDTFAFLSIAFTGMEQSLRISIKNAVFGQSTLCSLFLSGT